MLAGPVAGGEAAAVACHAFTPDAEYVETTVVRQLEGGEVTLRVPGQYFEDFWDLAGGFRDTAQLFVVEIGSFDPITWREEGERNRQGIWNWMHFVVGDNVPLPEMAAIAAAPFEVPPPSVTAYAMRPGEHGLTWLDTPHASDKAEAQEDVYIHPADYHAMTSVVSCTSPLYPPSRNPRCQQSFRAADLDVQLSYDRTELARWREFQAQVTAFLTCATSQAS
jgi:hypothetical protein